MTVPHYLSSGRIPSLDGTRAAAVLAVTAAHAVHAPGSPFPESWHALKVLGAAGVNVFFVLSGFLITHLLLRELERSGRVSLRGFWRRRALRILPAYFFLVAVAALLAWAGYYSVRPWVWPRVATYTLNLFPDRLVADLGYTWSLCVEEHFYLLWPLALVLLGRRSAPWFLALLVALAPVLRFALAGRPDLPDPDYFTPTRLDTISFGCLLAYFVRTDFAARLSARVRPRASLVALAASAAFLLSVFVLSRSGKYALGPKAAVEAACVCAFLFAVTLSPQSGVGRVLNWRPLAAVGVLSYSLYLGQLFSYAGVSPGWPLSWWWNVPLVFAYALASYFLVERPFLRVKDRGSATAGAAGGVRPV